jgi:hypothetical protein
MTDGDGAAARPETAVLMLAEDEAFGMLASGANAEAV